MFFEFSASFFPTLESRSYVPCPFPCSAGRASTNTRAAHCLLLLGTFSLERHHLSFLVATLHCESCCQENECFLQAKTEKMFGVFFLCYWGNLPGSSLCMRICLHGTVRAWLTQAVPYPSAYWTWMCTSLQVSPTAHRHPACSYHP